MKLITFVFLISISLATLVTGQTTAFTYQGKLTDGGTPSNGTYDLAFKLYDMQAGGTQIGSDQVKEDVTASNGIFTVVLDFGSSPFTSNSGRYLEIGVRPGASTAPFITLAPRQPITSSPYAVQTLRAESAGIADDASSLGGTPAASFVQTTDTRLSDARTPTAGSNDYVQNRNTIQGGASSYVGTGRATFLRADLSLFVDGVDPNGSTVAPTVTFGDGVPFRINSAVQAGRFSVLGNGNVGIGVPTPTEKLEVNGNASVTGQISANVLDAASSFRIGSTPVLATYNGGRNIFGGAFAGVNNAGVDNSFFGSESGMMNTSGNSNSFFGRSTGTSNVSGSRNTIVGADANVGSGALKFAGAIGANATVSTNDTIVIGKVAGSYDAENRPADTVIVRGDLNVQGTILGSIANAVNASQLGGVAASQYVQTSDNRLSDARPPTAGSANYIQNGTGVQPLSNFNISGGGTVGGALNAGMVNTNSVFRIGGANFASVPNTATTVVGETPAHNSTAVQNSFFGYAAGASIVFGKSNSFFGLFAGQGTTSGDANSFFGASSGTANVDGMGNTGLGSEAGSSNTSGDFNVFVGIGSGSGSSTGNGNTFVGTSTGITGGNGDNNTALGSDAKITGALSNATALGWRASATTSNSLVLGSINGINGATANTNIGVGTTAPSFRFHVRANGQDGIKIQHTGTGLFPQIRWTDSADAFKASIGVDTSGTGSMNFFVNGSDRMVIENNGLVRTPGGIFIANPSTLVITSPNGACWGITVSNTGSLSTFATPCP